MPAKKKGVPDEWNKEAWAQRVAVHVLKRIPKSERHKIPPAQAIELARLCFDADSKLREEHIGGTVGPYSKALLDALSGEFGASLDFMARVRRVWYKERGARDVEQHSGESGVSGFAMPATPAAFGSLLEQPAGLSNTTTVWHSYSFPRTGVTAKTAITPKTLAHWMARDDYHAWQKSVREKTKAYPSIKDIADLFEGLGYERPTEDQIRDAQKLVKKNRKTPGSE